MWRSNEENFAALCYRLYWLPWMNSTGNYWAFFFSSSKQFQPSVWRRELLLRKGHFPVFSLLIGIISVPSGFNSMARLYIPGWTKPSHRRLTCEPWPLRPKSKTLKTLYSQQYPTACIWSVVTVQLSQMFCCIKFTDCYFFNSSTQRFCCFVENLLFFYPSLQSDFRTGRLTSRHSFMSAFYVYLLKLKLFSHSSYF